MKTLFKSVSAAFVTLFLSISLSGCFDEGAKTASQGGGSGFFASKGVTISIPKFNQEKEISLDFFGPSIAADPEIEKFYKETWSLLGHKARKESWASNLVAVYVTTNGGNEILIPSSIVKKLHEYKLRVNGKEYVVWADGMDTPFILPLV